MVKLYYVNKWSYVINKLGFGYLVSTKRSNRITNLFFLLVAGSLAALLSFLSSISGLRRPQNENDLTKRSRRPTGVLWLRSLKRFRRNQHCLSFVSTHDVHASVIVFVLETCPCYANPCLYMQLNIVRKINKFFCNISIPSPITYYRLKHQMYKKDL